MYFILLIIRPPMCIMTNQNIGNENMCSKWLFDCCLLNVQWQIVGEYSGWEQVQPYINILWRYECQRRCWTSGRLLSTAAVNIWEDGKERVYKYVCSGCNAPIVCSFWNLHKGSLTCKHRATFQTWQPIWSTIRLSV